MAFRFVVVYVALVAALCLVIMTKDASGCSNGFGCYYAQAALPKSNRKMLHGFNRGVSFKSTVGVGSLGNEDKGNLVGSDLRMVPSGPDPLHHHGGSPKSKKPQTP